MKKYKQSTKEFNIPVLGYEDSIVPEIEIRKGMIIENLLLAGLGGVDDCIFQEGSYEIIQDEDSSYSVLLNSNGNSTSAVGVVDGRYFKGGKSIKWSGLSKGKEYYLYIKKGMNIGVNPHDIKAISFTTKRLTNAYCLMAVVSLIGDSFNINSKPQGKHYSFSKNEHLDCHENPHGESLTQDFVKILKNALFVAQGSNIPIQIDDQRTALLPLIKTSGELIVEDKRTSLKLSDKDNTTIPGNSLFQVINNLDSKIKELQKEPEVKFINFEGVEQKIEMPRGILGASYVFSEVPEEGTLIILNIKDNVLEIISNKKCKALITVHHKRV